MKIHSGIYTITNIITNKIYVGSTIKNFSIRKAQHLNKLRNNTHANRYLQSSFNKYGEENFKFEILEECDKEYCLSKEQYWINMLNVCNRNYGYNLNPVSSNCSGRKLSTEHKNKIKKANTGKRHSEESIEKMRRIKKGRIVSDEHLKKMSLAQLGKKLSSTTKTKISLGLKKLYKDNLDYGLKWKKQICKLDKNNKILKEYNSITEASQQENLNLNAISHCLNNRCKTSGGYIWKYKEDITNG